MRFLEIFLNKMGRLWVGWSPYSWFLLFFHLFHESPENGKDEVL